MPVTLGFPREIPQGETVKHEQHRDNAIDKANVCLEGLIILSGEQESPHMNGDKKKRKILIQ